MYCEDYTDLWENKPTCRQCEDYEEKLENIKDYMQGVLAMVYGTETFNRHKFETYLDEICFSLNMQLNEGDMKIEPITEKPKSYFEIVKNLTLNYARK